VVHVRPTPQKLGGATPAECVGRDGDLEPCLAGMGVYLTPECVIREPSPFTIHKQRIFHGILHNRRPDRLHR